MAETFVTDSMAQRLPPSSHKIDVLKSHYVCRCELLRVAMEEGPLLRQFYALGWDPTIPIFLPLPRPTSLATLSVTVN